MKLLVAVITLLLFSSAAAAVPAPTSFHNNHNLNLNIGLYSQHIQTDTIPNRVTLESPYPIYPSLQASYMKVYAPNTVEVSVADPRYLGHNKMSIAINSTMRGDSSVRTAEYYYGTYAIYWRVLDSRTLDLREGITTFAVVAPAPATTWWCDTDMLLVACALFCLFLVYEEVGEALWRNRY